MFEGWSHWVLLAVSHLCRSVLENLGQAELKAEITHLRVEVHRAKDLIKNYNLVLETCERDLGWLSFSGRLVGIGYFVLGIFIAGLLYYLGWGRRIELPAPLCLTNSAAVPASPIVERSGPTRPSDRLRTASR